MSETTDRNGQTGMSLFQGEAQLRLRCSFGNHLRHLLGLFFVFDQKATPVQKVLKGIDDFVERRGSTTLLGEASDAEISVASMLENDEEFASEIDRFQILA